jgi:hypothetical protein
MLTGFSLSILVFKQWGKLDAPSQSFLACLMVVSQILAAYLFDNSKDAMMPLQYAR